MTKCIVSQPGVHIHKLLEQSPCRLFADGQVLIMRLNLLLVCRVDYADTQPGAYQWIEYFQLRLVKWEYFVVARYNMRSSREGISFVQHRIASGDGQFADGVGMLHVTKVNRANDSSAGIAHEDVVIVGIVVYDTRAQCGQYRY